MVVSFSEQSANLPGKELTSKAFLRRVNSRALRAASRARLALVAFSMIFFASAGCSSKKTRNPSDTIVSVIPLTSLLPSLPFVWPSNCGSNTFTLTTAVKPSRTSSPVKLLSFSFKMPALRP